MKNNMQVPRLVGRTINNRKNNHIFTKNNEMFYKYHECCLFKLNIPYYTYFIKEIL